MVKGSRRAAGGSAMNLYTISLFVHMMGLIALFGAFILLQNSGRRLRSATRWSEASP